VRNAHIFCASGRTPSEKEKGENQPPKLRCFNREHRQIPPSLHEPNGFSLAYRKIRGLASEKLSVPQPDLPERNGFSSQGLMLGGAIGPLMRLQQKIDVNSRIFDPKTKTVIIVGNAGV
jgi:hypothetical protein